MTTFPLNGAVESTQFLPKHRDSPFVPKKQGCPKIHTEIQGREGKKPEGPRERGRGLENKVEGLTSWFQTFPKAAVISTV